MVYFRLLSCEFMYYHASQTIGVEITFLQLEHSQGASLGLHFEHCCEIYICMVGNSSVSPNDRFYKIRLFITHLQYTFPSCYNPSQELSIDASLERVIAGVCVCVCVGTGRQKIRYFVYHDRKLVSFITNVFPASTDAKVAVLQSDGILVFKNLSHLSFLPITTI